MRKLFEAYLLFFFFFIIFWFRCIIIYIPDFLLEGLLFTRLGPRSDIIVKGVTIGGIKSKHKFPTRTIPKQGERAYHKKCNPLLFKISIILDYIKICNYK